MSFAAQLRVSKLPRTIVFLISATINHFAYKTNYCFQGLKWNVRLEIVVWVVAKGPSNERSLGPT